MLTVLIPIVLAGLYGIVMFQFSAWSLKRQLSRQSNPLIDKNLEKIMAKFANILEDEKIRINIFETDPINGLAAPDGRIFITKGFYKKGKKHGNWVYYTILGEVEWTEIWNSGVKIFDSRVSENS